VNYRIEDTGELVVSRWPVQDSWPVAHIDEHGSRWELVPFRKPSRRGHKPNHHTNVFVRSPIRNPETLTSMVHLALSATCSGDFDQHNEHVPARIVIAADWMGVVAFSRRSGDQSFDVFVWSSNILVSAFNLYELRDRLALPSETSLRLSECRSHRRALGPPNLPPCPHHACQSDRLIALDCYLSNVAGPLAEAIDG